jgi:hypothetical protein
MSAGGPTFTQEEAFDGVFASVDDGERLIARKVGLWERTGIISILKGGVI